MQRWIVVADSSRAAVYELEPGLRLRPVQQFFNPQGRAQNRELVSDADGRLYGRGEREQGHAAGPGVSAVRHEQDLFAREVCSYVNEAVLQQRCGALELIAAPAFLGLMRPLLHKLAQQCLEREVARDVSGLSPTELADWLRAERERAGR